MHLFKPLMPLFPDISVLEKMDLKTIIAKEEVDSFMKKGKNYGLTYINELWKSLSVRLEIVYYS